MVFYSLLYLKAYEVRVPVDVSIDDNSYLPDKYPIQVEILKRSWFIYKNFMDVANNVLAHPNYSLQGGSEGQSIYSPNFIPKVVDPFSSISEIGLYRYLYDAYALQNLRSLNIGRSKNEAAVSYHYNNISRLVSGKNSLLRDLNKYNPFVQERFYKMNEKESTFVSLVIDYINCFLETRKISEKNIQKAIDTDVIKLQVVEIYLRKYTHEVNFIVLENIILELAEYSMYWVFRLKELLLTLDIHQQFLGLTIFFFIKETNNRLFLKLAGLGLCPMDSKILQVCV